MNLDSDYLVILKYKVRAYLVYLVHKAKGQLQIHRNKKIRFIFGKTHVG